MVTTIKSLGSVAAMMDNTSISLFLWEFDSDMWICHAINLVAILNILTVLEKKLLRFAASIILE